MGTLALPVFGLPFLALTIVTMVVIGFDVSVSRVIVTGIMMGFGGDGFASIASAFGLVLIISDEPL